MDEPSTLEELIATAAAAERNAVRAYMTLSDQMEQHGKRDIARLFKRLAAEEKKHDKEVSQLAARFGVKIDPMRKTPMWHDPAAILVDRDEATSPSTSTPYKALAYAVDNEELAFRYFSYVAATASEERTRHIAEAFAREELGHAALLRAERRRAYHAQRQASSHDPLPDPGQIRSLPRLVNVAMAIESAVADRVAASDDGSGSLRTLIQQIHQIVEMLKNEGAGFKPGVQSEIQAPAAVNSPEPASITKQGQLVREACDALDLAFAFYDGVVRQAPDEATAVKAQWLAAATLEHLEMLQKAT